MQTVCTKNFTHFIAKYYHFFSGLLRKRAQEALERQWNQEKSLVEENVSQNDNEECPPLLETSVKVQSVLRTLALAEKSDEEARQLVLEVLSLVTACFTVDIDSPMAIHAIATKSVELCLMTGKLSLFPNH